MGWFLSSFCWSILYDSVDPLSENQGLLVFLGIFYSMGRMLFHHLEELAAPEKCGGTPLHAWIPAAWTRQGAWWSAMRWLRSPYLLRGGTVELVIACGRRRGSKKRDLGVAEEGSWLFWGVSLRRKRLSGMTIYNFPEYSDLSYLSHLTLCDSSFAWWVVLFWWLLV